MGVFKEKVPTYEDDATIAVTNVLDRLNKSARRLETRSIPLHNFTPSVARMLNTTIDKLKSSNFKMQKQLSSESSSIAYLTEQKAYLAGDDTLAKDQSEAQEEIYSSKTLANQERVNRLERVVEEFHFGIMERRRGLGGVYADKEERERTFRHINILEHRLHRARIDFNRRITSNRGMRQLIHNLRMDRVMVERQIAHLLKQTDRAVANITEVVDRTTALAEGRDQSTLTVCELRRGGDREHRQYQEQWRELGRLVSYNSKIVGHIQNLSDRKLIKEKEKWAQSQEHELRKIMTAAAWDIAKDKACIKVTQARVEMYTTQFEKLRQATSVDGMKELVAVFEDSEDNNFRQFQTVNMMSNDIEELEQTVMQLRDENETIEDAKKYGDGGNVVDGVLREKMVSQTNLAKLTARLAETSRMMADLDEKTEDHARTISNLRSGIGKILLMFGEESNPLATTPVTEGSLTIHLDFMEEIVRKLLHDHMTQMNGFSENVHIKSDFDITEKDEDAVVAAGAAAITVVPPSTVKTEENAYDSDSEGSEGFSAPFITAPQSAQRRRTTITKSSGGKGIAREH